MYAEVVYEQCFKLDLEKLEERKREKGLRVMGRRGVQYEGRRFI
jgi:hypothetical protein